MTILRFLVRLACVLGILTFVRVASAVPEAHILRIDPRAGITGNTPILTTVVEIVQFNSPSDALRDCNGITDRNGALDCWANTMEKDGVLWTAFKDFPKENAFFAVKINGADVPAKLDGEPVRWEKALAANEPNVGTAWVIAVDASSGMGARYADARQVAHDFIASMKPNDLMQIVIFDSRERQYVGGGKWRTFKERNALVADLDSVPGIMPNSGDRPLFNIIKGITKDTFGNLGNLQGPQAVPMHQAMVVLSNGAGRGDPASASPSAEVFSQYMNKGRFPEDNTALPKTPLPVISVWFPSSGGFANDLYKTNDAQFMQALANTQIGGFFTVVRQGQGDEKGNRIVNAVRKRFNAMWVVKWRLACLNPSVEQSFTLQFKKTNPQITGDSSFKEVPIGVDPTQWPLDVNVTDTQNEANAHPLFPGGTFKVFGNFCWGGDKNRAEAYFIPGGTKPDQNTSSPDPNDVQKAITSLIGQGMRGSALEAGDAFATFQIPDKDELLEGTGDATVAHIILYDNGAKRTSGRDATTILTLKAAKKPLPWLLIAGGGGAVVLIGLVIVVIMKSRGGGGGGGRGRRGTPAPVVATPPYGGYGTPQPPPYGGGGGYGTPPYGGGGGGGPPPYQGGFAPNPNEAPPPVEPAGRGAEKDPQVPDASRCPSCGTPFKGTPLFCFGCGKPLDKLAEAYPLTGAMPAATPPPNPYGSVTLAGIAGTFALPANQEVRLGRDPSQCAITLQEPRISGVHATLKVENGQLWVRDEGSNNGTFVQGSRIQSGAWVAVPLGGAVRFGLIQLEARG